MQKHHLTIKGIRIAYIEQNPDCKDTIFFIHGNSVSSASWMKQLSSELLGKYRLIAFDLPAHGDSEASPEPDNHYTFAGLASIATLLVEQLETGPYIICGVSLGTNIMAEMIPFGVDPSGMFFAGSCLMGEGIGLDRIALPGADLSVFFSDGAEDEAVMKYRSLTSISEDLTDAQLFLADFKKVQTPFRSTFINSIMTGNLGDHFRQVNSSSCLMGWVFGAGEKVVDPHYLDDVDIPKWKDKVFQIPRASHLVNIDQPEAFNKLLAEFAVDCFE
jgi:pimeloyl-ACP methyl ester carboxylesterase